MHVIWSSSSDREPFFGAVPGFSWLCPPLLQSMVSKTWEGWRWQWGQNGWLSQLTVSSTWSLSAICHDLSLPDIRLDSKTCMFSDGKRWKPQKYSETEVVITRYQDQWRGRDNESCHQNLLRLQMILYSALIHLILPINRMNNGPSSVFSACSLVC